MSGLFGIHQLDGRPLDIRAIAHLLPPGTPPPALRDDSPTLISADGWSALHRQSEGLVIGGAAHLLDSPATPGSASGLGAVAATYAMHGLDFCRHLDGQFAFALVDESQRRLVLAVDRFATRSLFYGVTGNVLVFASSLDAFPPLLRADLDAQALLEYFLYTVVPSPRTPYRGIRKVDAAHVVIVDAGGVRTLPYWRMTYAEERNGSPAQWAQRLRAEIERTMQRHLAAEPSLDTVGAFLSGGTDSSTVAGLMARSVPTPARVFSIGYAEAGYDELAYARAAAERFGLDHRVHSLGPAEAFTTLPEIVRYYQEPFGNASALATLSCVRLAHRDGLRVLYAGDGGDELFAGNERYRSDAIFGLYQRVPRPVREAFLDPLFATFPDGRIRRYVRRSNLPNPRRTFSYNLLLTEPLTTLLTGDFLAATDPQALLSPAETCFHALPTASELNRLMHLDLKLAIADNDVRKVSGMAELAGVAVRYPLLDTQLAEFSGRIPSHLKLRRLEKRHIFKQALADFLPAQILSKPKHGFGVPVSTWMKTDPAWKGFVADLLHDTRTRHRGYLIPSVLDGLWRQHQASESSYYGDVLWPLLMLELWHREHAPSIHASPATPLASPQTTTGLA